MRADATTKADAGPRASNVATSLPRLSSAIPFGTKTQPDRAKGRHHKKVKGKFAECRDGCMKFCADLLLCLRPHLPVLIPLVFLVIIVLTVAIVLANRKDSNLQLPDLPPRSWDLLYAYDADEENITNMSHSENFSCTCCAEDGWGLFTLNSSNVSYWEYDPCPNISRETPTFEEAVNVTNESWCTVWVNETAEYTEFQTIHVMYNESYNESNINNSTWQILQRSKTLHDTVNVRIERESIFQTSHVVPCSWLYTSTTTTTSTVNASAQVDDAMDNSTNETCVNPDEWCVTGVRSSATLGGLNNDLQWKSQMKLAEDWMKTAISAFQSSLVHWFAGSSMSVPVDAVIIEDSAWVTSRRLSKVSSPGRFLMAHDKLLQSNPFESGPVSLRIDFTVVALPYTAYTTDALSKSLVAASENPQALLAMLSLTFRKQCPTCAVPSSIALTTPVAVEISIPTTAAPLVAAPPFPSIEKGFNFWEIFFLCFGLVVGTLGACVLAIKYYEKKDMHIHVPKLPSGAPPQPRGSLLKTSPTQAFDNVWKTTGRSVEIGHTACVMQIQAPVRLPGGGGTDPIRTLSQIRASLAEKMQKAMQAAISKSGIVRIKAAEFPVNEPGTVVVAVMFVVDSKLSMAKLEDSLNDMARDVAVEGQKLSEIINHCFERLGLEPVQVQEIKVSFEKAISVDLNELPAPEEQQLSDPPKGAPKPPEVAHHSGLRAAANTAVFVHRAQPPSLQLESPTCRSDSPLEGFQAKPPEKLLLQLRPVAHLPPIDDSPRSSRSSATRSSDEYRAEVDGAYGTDDDFEPGLPVPEHDESVDWKSRHEFEDGSIFWGSLVDGDKSGQGCYVCPDGNVYTGQFKDDLAHGEGTMRLTGNTGIYSGQWRHGEMSGHGLLQFKGLWIYNGQFVNNNRHGKGRCEWPHQSRYYNGYWKNDLPDGIGEVWSEGSRATGGEIYRFVEGRPSCGLALGSSVPLLSVFSAQRFGLVVELCKPSVHSQSEPQGSNVSSPKYIEYVDTQQVSHLTGSWASRMISLPKAPRSLDFPPDPQILPAPLHDSDLELPIFRWGLTICKSDQWLVTKWGALIITHVHPAGPLASWAVSQGLKPEDMINCLIWVVNESRGDARLLATELQEATEKITLFCSVFPNVKDDDHRENRRASQMTE